MMKKRDKIGLIIILALIAAFAGWYYFLNVQPAVSDSEFGIYLLKNDELIISDEDIIWYYKNSHEIELTDEALRKIQALEVGVCGEPFVIKLGDKEIYNGSFWNPISSVPYAGIVIEIHFYSNDNIIELRKGYPPSSFQGIDPRGDPRIFDHFQRIGKLKE